MAGLPPIARWIRRTRTRLGELKSLYLLAPRMECAFRLRGGIAIVRRGEKEIWISRGNAVYAQDLIRNFDYYFDAVEPRKESGRLVVDYSRTALHTMREDGLSLWFPQLAEPMETTRIYLDRAHLKKGDVVLDCGAYAGGATYYFSRAVGPAGHVFAFEPDQESFRCLERNIALHDLANVTALQRGVWSRTGKVVFQAEGNMGSAIVHASDRESDTKTEIDAVSLLDFCGENAVQRVDFVKLDIEGSEAPVLEAADRFLDRFQPSMIIEVHRVKGRRTDADVQRILMAQGYSVEVVDQPGSQFPLLFAQPKKGARPNELAGSKTSGAQI